MNVLKKRDWLLQAFTRNRYLTVSYPDTETSHVFPFSSSRFQALKSYLPSSPLYTLTTGGMWHPCCHGYTSESLFRVSTRAPFRVSQTMYKIERGPPSCTLSCASSVIFRLNARMSVGGQYRSYEGSCAIWSMSVFIQPLWSLALLARVHFFQWIFTTQSRIFSLIDSRGPVAWLICR